MGYIIEAADRFVKIDRNEASIIADMLIEELARTFGTKPTSIEKPEMIARPADPARAPEVSKTFEIGSTYYGTFICDSDSQAYIQIVGRTPKQVKFVSVYNGQPETKVKRVKIFTDSDGIEYFFPFGQHSMTLTIRANRKS